MKSTKQPKRLRVVPFIERGNRDYGGCDRSTGDAYSSMTPDSPSDIIRGPCTPIFWFVFPIRLMRWITDRYFCHFMEIRKKNMKSTEQPKRTKSATKLSQTHWRIELCKTAIIPRFEMNVYKVIVFWQYDSYSYFKTSTEVISYWAIENLGDSKSTSRGFHPRVQMSNNTIPILMHQIRISTDDVSSVMRRRKRWKSDKMWNL
jgi:hypothetical protein